MGEGRKGRLLLLGRKEAQPLFLENLVGMNEQNGNAIDEIV
jgi:hypothetical protein